MVIYCEVRVLGLSVEHGGSVYMKDCPPFMGFAHQQGNQEFEAALAMRASCTGYDIITPTSNGGVL